VTTRRDLLGLAGAGLVLPFALRAQPARKNVVVLFAGEEEDDEPASKPFFEEMRRLGWSEGVNVEYERLYGKGTREYIAGLAKSVASRSPDLIFATTASIALTLVKEGGASPIVFSSVTHPVRLGLVSSLDKPGGNATGAFQASGEILRRRLLLAREAFPQFKQIGVLVDRRTNDYPRQRVMHEEDGKRVGFGVSIAEFTNYEAVAKAIATFRRAGIGLVCVSPSVILTARRREVAEIAALAKIALVAHRVEWAEAGAVMTYGADVGETLTRSARVADRILKGARPADTPVEQATRLELAVNVKAAHALGLTIPQALLDRADRRIE
jgi:putative tryptophan/tyrosine transport system substrate-binding protein